MDEERDAADFVTVIIQSLRPETFLNLSGSCVLNSGVDDSVRAISPDGVMMNFGVYFRDTVRLIELQVTELSPRFERPLRALSLFAEARADGYNLCGRELFG